MTDPLDNIRKTRTSTSKVQPRSAGKTAKVVETEEKSRAGFGEMLREVSAGPVEKRLEGILDDIGRLAKILSKRRLLEDLEEYRNRVGDFLKMYLDDVLDVKEAAGRYGVSRRKHLLVVKRVNVELEELSRLVLGGAPDFEVVRELDTIQGLLMDLYT